MKRFIHYFTSVALAFVLPLTAVAQTIGVQVIINGKTVVFNDVTQSAWFATYVRASAEAGIVTGYEDASGNLTGKFGPSNSITLAEALKIAVEGAGYDEAAYGTQIDSDVEHWSSAYVSVAKAEQFSIASLLSRNLDRNATRAEVAAIFASAFHTDLPVATGGSYTDVSASTSNAAAIEALTRDKVVSGDTDIHGKITGTFRPGDPINRAEVAKIVMEARTVYGKPGTGRLPSAASETDDHVVTYTAAGFSPSVIRIPKGSSVTFKSQSTTGLRVASNPHPAHTDISSFDSVGILGNGETYVYTFTRVGSFGYHNHLEASHAGTIIVE